MGKTAGATSDPRITPDEMAHADKVLGELPDDPEELITAMATRSLIRAMASPDSVISIKAADTALKHFKFKKFKKPTAMTELAKKAMGGPKGPSEAKAS